MLKLGGVNNGEDKLYIYMALVSVGFPRQEYQSGLSCPAPGGHPNLGIKPASLMSPALIYICICVYIYIYIYIYIYKCICVYVYKMGFLGGLVRIHLQCWRRGFDPWIVGMMPWKRKWQLTPVFLTGEFHGQWSLEVCTPWCHKSQTELSD